MDKIILWIANNLMAQPDPSWSIRSKPMGVLGLGLSRTGTQSLSQALEILGYDEAYHGFKSLTRRGEWSFWIRACLSKYRGIGNFGGEDWEQLLGSSAAVTDTPCIGFASELISQYPDAKVILTVRPVDDWITSTRESWEKTAQFRTGWRPLTILFCWDYMLAIYVMSVTLFRYLAPWMAYNGVNLRWKFEEHNAMIRGLVPPERLLIYHVSEGWAPLCKFLGKPIPDVPMPKGNQKENFGEAIKNTHKHLHRQMMTNMAIFFSALAAGVAYYVCSR